MDSIMDPVNQITDLERKIPKFLTIKAQQPDDGPHHVAVCIKNTSSSPTENTAPQDNRHLSAKGSIVILKIAIKPRDMAVPLDKNDPTMKEFLPLRDLKYKKRQKSDSRNRRFHPNFLHLDNFGFQETIYPYFTRETILEGHHIGHIRSIAKHRNQRIPDALLFHLLYQIASAYRFLHEKCELYHEKLRDDQILIRYPGTIFNSWNEKSTPYDEFSDLPQFWDFEWPDLILDGNVKHKNDESNLRDDNKTVCGIFRELLVPGWECGEGHLNGKCSVEEESHSAGFKWIKDLVEKEKFSWILIDSSSRLLYHKSRKQLAGERNWLENMESLLNKNGIAAASEHTIDNERRGENLFNESLKIEELRITSTDE
ncbi:hypothetical protein BS50DRAFT_636825 [Corynespora cassiicola Philippines]|uniref:Protein kinase domain-containing protein n=1 Tax=Corynespora cassiicola Philippines TaxID=1448308 RepID=A0A2T2NGW8_CORCC|nr:hypothetical protein BS50DRAFT_636825 [Corynespora cassiicola Philippines]